MKGPITMTREQLNEVADLVASKVSLRLETYIAGQDARCAAHHTATAEHHKSLYGNGQPGIVSQIQRLRVVSSIAAFLAGGTFLALIGAIVSKLFA